MSRRVTKLLELFHSKSSAALTSTVHREVEKLTKF